MPEERIGRARWGKGKMGRKPGKGKKKTKGLGEGEDGTSGARKNEGKRVIQVGSKEGKEARCTAVLYTAQHSDSAARNVAGCSH